MITLNKDKFEVEISIKDVMPIDTKANMLECFRMLGVKVSKSCRKDELAGFYDNFFRQQTGYILDCLPKEEFQMLTRLLDMPKEQYIECPSKPDKFFFLQKCYLVFTYEIQDIWHIYMGDYVRNILKDHLARSMKSYPSIQEMQEILEEFSGLNKEMMTLLELHDPKNLSDSDKKKSATLIALNPDYEQDIFTRRAIDQDCNLISILMDAEKENIRDLLEAQRYEEASLNYMQLLKSMCRHFVSDEHYNYFDDMYCPDYTATDITNMFKDYHLKGKLPQTVVDYLDKAWDEIRKEESYWNYGIPSVEWQ